MIAVFRERERERELFLRIGAECKIIVSKSAIQAFVASV